MPAGTGALEDAALLMAGGTRRGGQTPTLPQVSPRFQIRKPKGEGCSSQLTPSGLSSLC